MKGLSQLSLSFAAGCVGGLICSLVAWFSSEIGINAHYHIKVSVELSKEWIYQRMIWGGLWGMLFALPIAQYSGLLRGAILSVGPSLVQLFIIFPIVMKKGVMGQKLGELVPIYVLIINAIWGLITAYWLKQSQGK